MRPDDEAALYGEHDDGGAARIVSGAVAAGAGRFVLTGLRRLASLATFSPQSGAKGRARYPGRSTLAVCARRDFSQSEKASVAG